MSIIDTTANPLGTLAQSIATATVRHAVTAAAGALVAKGVLAPGQSDQAVSIGTGLVLGLISLGWSFYQKCVAHRAVSAARS